MDHIIFVILDISTNFLISSKPEGNTRNRNRTTGSVGQRKEE